MIGISQVKYIVGYNVKPKVLGLKPLVILLIGLLNKPCWMLHRLLGGVHLVLLVQLQHLVHTHNVLQHDDIVHSVAGCPLAAKGLLVAKVLESHHGPQRAQKNRAVQGVASSLATLHTSGSALSVSSASAAIGVGAKQ